MKYLRTISFTVLLIFAIGLHAYCQTNGNGKEKPDTTGMVKVVRPPDSVAIVSLKDYDTFYKFLQDNVSKSQYDKLKPEDVLKAFGDWAILEYNRKKKK